MKKERENCAELLSSSHATMEDDPQEFSQGTLSWLATMKYVCTFLFLSAYIVLYPYTVILLCGHNKIFLLPLTSPRLLETQVEFTVSNLGDAWHGPLVTPMHMPVLDPVNQTVDPGDFGFHVYPSNVKEYKSTV